ncbi:hypothetical protein QQZ08_000320 [Neonectria magnoliae]|uniref:AMMECR1 domain-containing protein n=1 Tax=Neonectria magnoliae TaxID=2732573 RepID=A0ABR1II99_9HYPO
MATTEHCLACFEALDAHLSNRKPLSLDEIQATLVASASVASPPSPKSLQDPALRRLAADSESSSSSSTSLAASTPATSTSSLPLPPSSAPLFVTWNTMDDDDDPSLRGCIGTFESQPLAEGIPEYSLVSALQDSRFPPIRKAELPTLQVAVTLLTDFEEVDDKYDWDVGVHGLRLSFYDRGRRYGSTYLPDVAAEQGWTKDETLFSLIRKAGWMGSRKHWKDLDLNVTRYQGKKSTLEYSAFKKWRAGLDA